MKNKKTIDIKEHFGLVHLCCQRFRGKSIDYEELFQCGCLGLVKAAKNFDWGRNIKFSTYAVPMILGEIRNFFRNNSTLKVSRSIKELSFKIGKFQEEFISDHSRSPSINEICDFFGITTEQALEALEINKPLISLDDEGKSKEATVSFEDENINFKISLANALKFFEKRDKELIYLRFFKLETQSNVAKKLGMTQVQVSRREKVLLKALREKLT